MNRRDLIAKFSNKAALTGAGIAATTAVAYPRARDGAAAGMKKLAGEVKGMQKRFDEMEESHRRMTKMLVTVVCMSTGLDVLTVLKGDWL